MKLAVGMGTLLVARFDFSRSRSIFAGPDATTTYRTRVGAPSVSAVSRPETTASTGRGYL